MAGFDQPWPHSTKRADFASRRAIRRERYGCTKGPDYVPVFTAPPLVHMLGKKMFGLLAQFAYLQLMDVLTTLAFLGNGMREANPMITLLARSAGSPLAGLLAAKLFALGLAAYCWRSGRCRLLGGATVFYAVVVAWNLVAYLVGRYGGVGA